MKLLIEQGAKGDSGVVLLRSKLRAVSRRMGFNDLKREQMELVCNEMVTNQNKFAEGNGLVQIWETAHPKPALDLFALDYGKGILNIKAAVEDGFTTAGTMGKGLGAIRRLQTMPDEELMAFAKELGAPYELVKEIKELGRLPVVNFAAGGIATPADAALMMQLGVDGVFVGSGIFKSGDPARRADAIVKATAHFNNPKILAEVSRNLGEPMVGRQVTDIPKEDLIAQRGW